MLILAIVYFAPAICAWARHHRNAGAITALNLLLGWTILGWVAALVWSLTNPSRVASLVVATMPRQEIEEWAREPSSPAYWDGLDALSRRRHPQPLSD